MGDNERFILACPSHRCEKKKYNYSLNWADLVQFNSLCLSEFKFLMNMQLFKTDSKQNALTYRMIHHLGAFVGKI